jgi:hypothetical protein
MSVQLKTHQLGTELPLGVRAHTPALALYALGHEEPAPLQLGAQYEPVAPAIDLDVWPLLHPAEGSP